MTLGQTAFRSVGAFLLLLLAGCPIVGILALFHQTPEPIRTVTGRANFQLEGQITLGSPNDRSPSGGLITDGGVAFLAPLTQSSPLAKVERLSISAPLAAITLTQAALLTEESPLVEGPTQAKGLVANNSAGLVGNNSAQIISPGGGGLAGLNAARILSTPSKGKVFAELVDPASGELWARVHPDSAGRFKMAFPEDPGERAFFVQVTAFRSGKIVAFLSSPFASGESDKESSHSVIVSPGSTTLALAGAVLAGVRHQFTLDTGFRGFRTSSLAKLVAHGSPPSLGPASRILDATTTFATLTDFDQFLAKAVTVSASLARSVNRKAQEAALDFPTLLAAKRVFLQDLARTPVVNQTAEALVEAVEAKIVTRDIIAAAEAIKSRPGSRALEEQAVSATETPVSVDTPRTPAPTKKPSEPEISTLRVTTVAGQSNRSGELDGPSASGTLNAPSALAWIPENKTLLIVDEGNNLLRQISRTLVLSTLKLSTGDLPQGDLKSAAIGGATRNLYVASGTRIFGLERVPDSKEFNLAWVAGGDAGYRDGKFADARFAKPRGLVYVAGDGPGSLYLADTDNNCIRVVNIGLQTVTTIAGTDKPGFADGPSALARFSKPAGLARAQDKTIFVADTGNHRIRKITPEGEVRSIAGTGVAGFKNGEGPKSQFFEPIGIVLYDYPSVVVTDSGNNRLRKISGSGEVSTFAGSGLRGIQNGALHEAQFDTPHGIALDGGVIWVSDRGSHLIRKIAKMSSEL